MKIKIAFILQRGRTRHREMMWLAYFTQSDGRVLLSDRLLTPVLA